MHRKTAAGVELELRNKTAHLLFPQNVGNVRPVKRRFIMPKCGRQRFPPFPGPTKAPTVVSPPKVISVDSMHPTQPHFHIFLIGLVFPRHSPSRAKQPPREHFSFARNKFISSRRFAGRRQTPVCRHLTVASARVVINAALQPWRERRMEPTTDRDDEKQ